MVCASNESQKRPTGSTCLITAVRKPPSQVPYIAALWEKLSNMECIAADCVLEGAAELEVRRQILSDAIGQIRCAVLPIMQC